jgi:hypothetical protein
MQEFLVEWVDHSKPEDDKDRLVRFRMRANHYAWQVLEQLSGKSIWDWIDGYARKESLSDSYQLLYALSATHRLRTREISYAEFLQLVPDEANAWDELQDKLVQILAGSFFWPTLLKMAWRIVNHHLETHQKRESAWIGSSGSIGPSESASPLETADTNSMSQTSTECSTSMPTTTPHGTSSHN